MRLLLIFAFIVQYAVVFPSLPSLSRSKKVSQELQETETREEYRDRLILTFFLSKIEFEKNARIEDLAETYRKDKSINWASLDRLSKPKELQEKLVLPALVCKKLTEKQKSDLFDRLSQPKITSFLYEEPVHSSKKKLKKLRIKS